MSTMWNFHARFSRRGGTPIFGAAAIATAILAVSSAWASDAPGPAVASPAIVQTRTSETPPAGRIKIAAVSVRIVAPSDPMLDTLVAAPYRKGLRRPVLISVEVAQPFTNLERTASPVIVINGQTIGDSIVPFKERNRIVAVMRDGSRLQGTVTIQVGWLGDFDRTLSEPVQAKLVR
jgi:hypothetical protein